MNSDPFQLIPQDMAGAALIALAVFILIFWPYFT